MKLISNEGKEVEVDIEDFKTIKNSDEDRPTGPAYEMPEGTAETIGPDNRVVFRDKNHPWNQFGYIGSGGTTINGSGVLVAKNLVLTALHVVDPAFFKDMYFIPACNIEDKPNAPFEQPFEKYKVIHYWHWPRPRTDEDDAVMKAIGMDYVVLVLDRNTHASLGWADVVDFDQKTVGKAEWMHLGYPMSEFARKPIIKQGQPVYQINITVEKTEPKPYSVGKDSFHGEVLDTTAYTNEGQSGGPLFKVDPKTRQVWVSGVLSAKTNQNTLFAMCNDTTRYLVEWCKKKYPAK